MDKAICLKTFKEAKEFFEISQKINPNSVTVTELYKFFVQPPQSNRRYPETANNNPRKPKQSSPKV